MPAIASRKRALPKPKDFKPVPLKAVQRKSLHAPVLIYKAEIFDHLATNPQFKGIHKRNPKLVDAYIMGQLPLESLYNRHIVDKPKDMILLKNLKKTIARKAQPSKN